MRIDHGIAFLGTGAMGSALVRAVAGTGLVPPSQVYLHDLQPSLAQALAAETAAQQVDSNPAAVEQARTVVLCVKPAQVPEVLEEISPVITPAHLVISIAAGVRISRLEALLPPEVGVIRVMPNIAATVGEAASVLSPGRSVSPEQREVAEAIFSAAGRVEWADEQLLDAVTGVSGSGLAYAFLFAEAMADGGVRAGLPRALSLRLAAQILKGAGVMLLETGEHPGVLKDRVTSPGGTTIEAIAALESGGFRAAVIEAVTAAWRRSQELGQESR